MSMSLRIDTAELIAGALVIGDTGLGVRGDSIPATGEHGPSFLYPSLSLPADAAVEVRGLIVAPPSAGALFAYENGSFTFSGAPDGSYTFTFRVFSDGVDRGTAVASMRIGASYDQTPTPNIGPKIGVASNGLIYQLSIDNSGVPAYATLQGGSAEPIKPAPGQFLNRAILPNGTILVII
jgi:hypothetical protein